MNSFHVISECVPQNRSCLTINQNVVQRIEFLIIHQQEILELNDPHFWDKLEYIGRIGWNMLMADFLLLLWKCCKSFCSLTLGSSMDSAIWRIYFQPAERKASRRQFRSAFQFECKYQIIHFICWSAVLWTQKSETCNSIFLRWINDIDKIAKIYLHRHFLFDVMLWRNFMNGCIIQSIIPLIDAQY